MATQYAQLIKLEGAKDLEDEPHCCEKPHRSGHQADGDRRHPHVAVVDQKSGDARQLQLCVGVQNAVDVYVQPATRCAPESAPPPSMIFSTEREVAHHNANLGANDDHRDDHQGEETKQRIDSLIPHARDEETELD